MTHIPKCSSTLLLSSHLRKDIPERGYIQKKTRNFRHTAGEFSTPCPPNKAITSTSKSMFAIALSNVEVVGVRPMEYAECSVGQVGVCFSPTHLSPSINDKQHLAIRGIRLLHNFHLP